MAGRETVESREAEHGNRMIEIKVRFWTNDLVAEAKSIRPKHGWTSGVVRFKPNAAHGIRPGAPLVFNSLMEIPQAIEKLLIREGVTLHLSARMRRYVEGKG